MTKGEIVEDISCYNLRQNKSHVFFSSVTSDGRTRGVTQLILISVP